MQSNSSTFTNPIIATEQFFQNSYPPSISSTSSPPPPPPPTSSIPPPPPPPPLPAHFFINQSSPWSTLQLPSSSRKGRSRSNTSACKIFRNEFQFVYLLFVAPQPVDEFQQELTARLNGRIVTINENSTKEDVQGWLTSKKISPT